ncbi:hypothetical protein SY212_18240 [Ligilactobacillus agilis]|uniref:Recombinase RecT n=1 Tax=Ligilactobacillus agilis TaxID=1601 RepID=A0A6F9XNE0_9LACO|nr:RecT family recombinase [Ligilactobacillus agilis]GET06794.1 hypothetical protein SY212_18240 [Ligilactobacillus agilis]
MAQQTQQNQVALLQKDITDQVSKRITELEQTGLALPANFNAQNALKAAFFTLDKTKDRSSRPALEVCTKASIANALLDMVTQGLSPAKTQCYFIVYGNELQMQRSYFGTVTALKRLSDVEDIYAEVIHEGDEFEIDADEMGRTRVAKFKPSFANLDKPLIGAFAVIKKSDDSLVYTIMTKTEIDKSWSQSRNKNNHVQENFSQEMAKRTVINRAAKMFINTSDDSDLLTGAINNTTENEYDEDRNEPRKVVAKEKQPEQKSISDLFGQVEAGKPEKKEKPVVIEAEEKEPAESEEAEAEDVKDIITDYEKNGEGEIDMFRQQQELSKEVGAK